MVSVAVIGAGAVGGYYGALLARAGHDVRFLMRSGRAEVRARGLDVHSIRGDFHLPSVSVFASPEEIGPVDWVVCSLKATAIEQARELVAPCIGPTTRLLALMNGLGIEERFAEWFGPERIFGGMAFVCINRGEPGVIHHLEYGRVSIGHFQDMPMELASLQGLLESAQMEVTTAPSLQNARWEKLCWNIPFNGLSVAAGGVGTQTIVRDGPMRSTAERAMREVIAIGNADLAASGSTTRLDPDGVVDWMFAQTDTMGEYRTSMVIDFVLGREMETEAILGEPLRRAARLGVAAPTVETLYALVGAAGMRNRGRITALTPGDLEITPPSVV
ncbi:MAG: 2-dehydropantoate 2-reductase [Anaerolineaceae bacterium]